LGPAEWLKRHVPTRTVDSTYVPPDLGGTYNGTSSDMRFLVKDGRFGCASGNTFVPLTPISRYEYVSGNYMYRFLHDAAGKVVAVLRPYDGTVWLLGTSDSEPRGPEKAEWMDHTGSYVRKRFGVGERFYNVSMKNGWLHFQGDGQDFRLSEHTPGLFFTPDGEAVDFRGSRYAFRNIRLYKTCN
jgi:hypothetical protein